MEVEAVLFNIKDKIEQYLSEQPLLRLSKYRENIESANAGLSHTVNLAYIVDSS